MMINSFFNTEQLGQVDESLNQLIERIQSINIQQENNENISLKLDSFNLFDPIFYHLSDQNLDVFQKKIYQQLSSRCIDMYHVISEVIGKVNEEEFTFRKEEVDENQLSFLKRFIKSFMKYYKFCLGSNSEDLNQNYISTNSNISNYLNILQKIKNKIKILLGNKDFSQVYKKNPKYINLNINQSKFENPPEIQKAFTFSLPNTQNSKNNNAISNNNDIKNQQSSFLQKKYTFNFKFDENLLSNSPPSNSHKNVLKKGQIQQKQPSQTAKKQIQHSAKQIPQETIKHNTTIDLSHLKQNLLYDDHSPNYQIPSYQQEFTPTVKVRDLVGKQRKPHSKSPISSSSHKFGSNHFQKLQEFSDQYVNISLISKHENTINKENYHKDSGKKLQKDISNLSLNLKSSKRLSQTPIKSSRALPSSTKALNFQKEISGFSKSPQAVRTHQQILKTKRIEPYEKVMENLSNLQNFAPIDLTPRKQTKPFN